MNVAITDDTVAESDETFGLIVQANASDPVDTFLASATFKIVDNDGLSITPPAASVNENAGSVSFTVTRPGGSTQQTYYVSTMQNQGSTNAGDYTGLNAQALTFNVGGLPARR